MRRSSGFQCFAVKKKKKKKKKKKSIGRTLCDDPHIAGTSKNFPSLLIKQHRMYKKWVTRALYGIIDTPFALSTRSSRPSPHIYIYIYFHIYSNIYYNHFNTKTVNYIHNSIYFTFIIHIYIVLSVYYEYKVLLKSYTADLPNYRPIASTYIYPPRNSLSASFHVRNRGNDFFGKISRTHTEARDLNRGRRL